MKRTAFDLFHPVVAFGYFAVMFALSMTAMQPVYLAISLASVLSYSAVLRGWRATGRSLLWQLPLVAVVALANPLFSASGSTELFRLGLRAFYLESFVYGACMGVMLISVIVLFSNASQVLTSDKVMTLFGGVAPTIGLMLSMTARLVPPCGAATASPTWSARARRRALPRSPQGSSLSCAATCGGLRCSWAGAWKTRSRRPAP